MKYFILFLFLIAGPVIYSQVQDNDVCFVLYVKGEVKKSSGISVVKNDTILFKDIPNLDYKTENCCVNIFHPTLGTFQLTKSAIIKSQEHKSFIDFLLHLLKTKGNKISLSSRGSCVCLTPRACFYSDTAVNDKILLVDSLSFEADEILLSAEKGFYFLQYKNRSKKLRIIDGNVILSPSDFVFKDTSFSEGETPEMAIGLYVSKDGTASFNLVANVKFNLVPDSVLTIYYQSLKTAMNEPDLKKVYDSFSQDVYLYFGKPTECQLEKIINSINKNE